MGNSILTKNVFLYRIKACAHVTVVLRLMEYLLKLFVPGVRNEGVGG